MLTEQMTIARPYAKAVFESAREHNRLAETQVLLRNLALIVADSQLQPLLKDPRANTQQLIDLIVEVTQDETSRPLVALLAENRRLLALPSIATLFTRYRDAHEQQVEVMVTAYAPLSDAQQEKLQSALVQRLKRTVKLQCQTDKSLLGGAVIRAGDLVIDASVKRKLDELYQQIAA